MSKLAKALTAAAGNAGESLYVEDVFSTYLYAGNSSSQTITNGIDLSGEGGMVWTKDRTGTFNHSVRDSVRGGQYRLITNLTNSQADDTTTGITSFNSDGYTHGSQVSGNYLGRDYASWTFRKAEKFFDVVTYTGNGVAGRTVAHNLGSTPATIIIKCTTDTQSWVVYHTSLGATKYLTLNTTNASGTTSVTFNDTEPTDSLFSVGTAGSVNASGQTYVAYLFASDAGGFGDDGSENIIKCGSYTGNNSADGPTVTLGFEPQWVLIKESSAAGNAWSLYDMMRNGTMDQHLRPNSSDAESIAAASPEVLPQATGFKLNTSSGRVNRSQTYIYIAIRRPMKTPESGTEVFATAQRDTTAPIFEGGFPVDAAIIADVSGAWTNSPSMGSRLTGKSRLATSNTNAEASDPSFLWDYMNGWGDGSGSYPEYYSWMFKRATGFFDVVAYTGTGSNTTQSHNLGVAPEMIIVKRRSSVEDWLVYHSATGNQAGTGLNQTNATFTGVPQYWNSTSPTDSVFSLGTHDRVNTSAETYIAYLFATLAGVSKVGSYTGTGSNVNVDCGFSAGARFILIKRTDSTGDWYVWDSVRGIVAGNDPYLLLNSTAAEVTSTDYIDPLSSGFTVTSSAPAALNASGGTYIFLAIA